MLCTHAANACDRGQTEPAQWYGHSKLKRFQPCSARFASSLKYLRRSRAVDDAEADEFDDDDEDDDDDDDGCGF